MAKQKKRSVLLPLAEKALLVLQQYGNEPLPEAAFDELARDVAASGASALLAQHLLAVAKRLSDDREEEAAAQLVALAALATNAGGGDRGLPQTPEIPEAAGSSRSVTFVPESAIGPVAAIRPKDSLSAAKWRGEGHRTPRRR